MDEEREREYLAEADHHIADQQVIPLCSVDTLRAGSRNFAASCR
jgi:hypothetical protein